MSDSSDIPRYGCREPGVLPLQQLPDGYWSPWHLAHEAAENLRAQLAAAEAELDASKERERVLRHILAGEAEYCFGYAAKYAKAGDHERAARHRKRGERLQAYGERNGGSDGN